MDLSLVLSLIYIVPVTLRFCVIIFINDNSIWLYPRYIVWLNQFIQIFNITFNLNLTFLFYIDIYHIIYYYSFYSVCSLLIGFNLLDSHIADIEFKECIQCLQMPTLFKTGQGYVVGVKTGSCRSFMFLYFLVLYLVISCCAYWPCILYVSYYTYLFLMKI